MLHKIKKFTNDFPTKFFKETEDGEHLTLTPIGEYRALKGAVDYFKNLILQLDDEGKYTTLTTKEKINQEIYKERSGPYADQLRFLDEKYEEYRKEHLDEYNEIEMINNTDDTITAKGVIIDFKFSLDEAWYGYQYCNKMLKRFGKDGEDYDSLPKTVMYRSKDEFKEKHAQIKEKLRKDLLIPDESEFIVKEVATTKGIKRPKKADVENATDGEYVIYLENFVFQNLTR